jgi:hypothetical protein
VGLQDNRSERALGQFGTGVTSEANPRRSNAKATELGRGQARRILDLKNEDKGESLLMAKPYPSHNTGYTKTKERPAKIQ